MLVSAVSGSRPLSRLMLGVGLVAVLLAVLAGVAAARSGGPPASPSGGSAPSVLPKDARGPAVAPPQGASSSGGVVAHRVPASDPGYWTPERMRAAKPMPMPVVEPGGRAGG